LLLSKTFESKFEILPPSAKKWYLNLLQPVADFLVRLNLDPNLFTTIGFLLTVVAGFLIGTGSYRIGGLTILFAGTFDIIDGKVARQSNRVTTFGSFYDSVMDRFSEIFMFFGMLFLFIKVDSLFGMVSVALALGGSLMVSYTRAKAEALNFECKVGIMKREERVVYLGLAAIIHYNVLIFALAGIALLAHFTAIQRVYNIWVQDNQLKTETKQQDTEDYQS